MSRHANDEDILELTRRGLSADQIARRLKVCTRTVHRARVRNGVGQPNRRTGPRYTPEFLAKAEAHLDEGWSFREIGRTYGVDPERLSRKFPGRGWTKAQASELGAIRREEKRLFHALDNQRLNALHQLPMADQLCRSGAAFETMPGQPHTEAA